MRLNLRWDRLSVGPRGGPCHIVVSIPDIPVVAERTVLVLDWSLRDLSPHWPGSELLDCPLQEAWLRGCHKIAPEVLGPLGHCILLTGGHGELNPRQAAEVWEKTGIATSVVPLGPSPNEKLLRAFARQGGGSYGPNPRAVQRVQLALHPSPGLQVKTLRRRRGRVILQVQVRADSQLVIGSQTLEFRCGVEEPRDPAVVALVERKRRRRADRTAEGGANLLGRFLPAAARWPFPLARPDEERVRELYRGCLLGAGIGSALGRPVVGLEPATIRSRYGAEGLQGFEPWRADRPGSGGSVSGDTQILVEIARTVIDSEGGFDPERFSQRLLRLLQDNRGLGSACETAGAALAAGKPWWQAGALSGGNGAALRVAPVGLVVALGERRLELLRSAAVASLVTHTNPVGVGAALVMAQAVAYLVRMRLAARELEADTMLEFLAASVDAVEPVAPRRLGAAPVSLADRLREIPSLLNDDGALLSLGTGAFALESVPAALYCFLCSPEDPRQTLLRAVNAGHDADSVGCMAGQLAGAWMGSQALPPSWTAGLEGRDSLLELGDALAKLALAAS